MQLQDLTPQMFLDYCENHANRTIDVGSISNCPMCQFVRDVIGVFINCTWDKIYSAGHVLMPDCIVLDDPNDWKIQFQQDVKEQGSRNFYIFDDVIPVIEGLIVNEQNSVICNR